MSGRGILGRPAWHTAPKPLANHDVLLLDSDGHIPDNLDLEECFHVVHFERELVRGDKVDGDFLWDNDTWIISCLYVYHIYNQRRR